MLSSQGGIFHALPIPSMSPHRLDYNQLSFHYCLIFLQTTSVMFVSVDTVSIDDDKNDAESMKQLLESELAKAGDDEWKIVFGHYPCHSGGGYSGYRSMREQILPTMKAHNVDFYLTGHDHNLQHWRKKDNPADVDHIITGKASFNPACFQTISQELAGRIPMGEMKTTWIKMKRWGWNLRTSVNRTASPTFPSQSRKLLLSLSLLMVLQSTNIQEVSVNHFKLVLVTLINVSLA